MSLEIQLLNQLIVPSETLQREQQRSARSNSLPILRSSALESIISLALLIAVFVLVGYYYDASHILHDLRSLSFETLGIIVVALLANALAAVLRFKIIAGEIKQPISFQRAMAVVGGGSLAGAMFFQIAGQLTARGVIAARAGIPFAAILVITVYERFIAAIVSGLLALGGALYIFGNVYLDQSAGGADLIRIMFGLMAAATGGALLGYGRVAARSIAPLLTRHFVRRCFIIVGLTLLVQAPMMIAYVMAALAMSPQTSVTGLFAASAVVMFAASVPVSLAGWGMREMSAVVALGAIGVAAHAALTAAMTIGFGSVLAMAAIVAMALPALTDRLQSAGVERTEPIDYYRALAWGIPIATATLVLFQVFVPIRSGLVNVNLADPLAIAAGVLVVLRARQIGRLPEWRFPHVNLALAAATIALGSSLLIGAYQFGWTGWALINRFSGWFILLAYVATGVLIVSQAHKEGFRVLLLTFVGAAVTVAGIEITLVLFRSLGFSVSVIVGNVEGFAQNRNAFAFQLLMAMSAAIALVRGAALRIVILALMMMALWFAGSRSGWIAAGLVLTAAIYLGALTAREALIAIIWAAGAAVGAFLLSSWPGQVPLPGQVPGLPGQAMPTIVPSVGSTHERLITLFGGLNLFLDHPVFGAGLGAFRNEMILGLDGIPLVIHSTPIWLLAELGIVGFAVFAVSGAYIFLKAWRRARKEHASAVIVLCFVAFAVMSAPADMLYQRTFWLLLGAGLALVRSGRVERLH